MAGLALQGHGPHPDAGIVSEFIQAFTGSHRYILSTALRKIIPSSERNSPYKTM